MKKLNLPEGWTGEIKESRWKKPYGMCFRARRRVEVYPPKWAPRWFGIREYLARLTWNHEVLHAWGQKECWRPWCLGYEGTKRKEYIAMPFQLLFGLYFCDDCMSHYKGE